MFVVYIVECSDGSLYTGITTDIVRRVHEHNATRRGAAYTRVRRPVTVKYHRVYENRSAALKAEYRIKQLSRIQKIEFIRRQPLCSSFM